jgi:penicillin-binding protein 1C
VTVQTTLDLSLQSKAESSVARHITADIAAAGIDNAAVVVIDPQSGRCRNGRQRGLLNQQISGQVNNALSPNQPAGAMTPFIFLGAFRAGVAADDEGQRQSYWLVGSQGSTVLGNVDGIYRGDVTVRGSLSESLIVPAVRALLFAGTDETEELGRSMGLDSADEASRLGEGYAAGYANVSLVQLTGAYAVLANEGVIVGERSQAAGFPVARPYVIESVAAGGDVVWKPELFQQRVVSAGDAYLMTNILSRAYDKSKGDNPVFDRPAAFFSGLSDGNRDAWAVGYTRQFAIGVWVRRRTRTKLALVWRWPEPSGGRYLQRPISNSPSPLRSPSGIQFV